MLLAFFPHIHNTLRAIFPSNKNESENEKRNGKEIRKILLFSIQITRVFMKEEEEEEKVALQLTLKNRH